MAGTLKFGNFRFLGKYLGAIFQKPTKHGAWKNPVLPGSKFPLLAIHKIISHIWEDGSRKVNNGEPDLSFFHGNFWPVISHAVRKPCFSTSIPRGPNLCILDFQTPPAPPPDEFSNPDPGPSQRTHKIGASRNMEAIFLKKKKHKFGPLGFRPKNKVFERPGL